MAKLLIDLPREWEATITKGDDASQIEIEPSFVSGSALAPCLYLTSIGKGGMKRKVVIMLNGNTGWLEARRVKTGSSECAFDLPVKEFDKKSKKEDEEDDEAG